MKDLTGKTLVEQLHELTSPADFFLFFFLPYDEEVVKDSGKHIVRRMEQYLAVAEFSGLSDDEIFLTTRLELKNAYRIFAGSSPFEDIVFKGKAAEPVDNFIANDELVIAVAAE